MLSYKKFVQIFLAIVLLILSLIISVNIYVDPLLYFGGNKQSGLNANYNSRISKTILYSQSDKNYNCIIFGSSTAMYMHASEFKDYRCFNFSVSSGNIVESVKIAEYIKKFGKEPSIVIVGVDAFNFKRNYLKPTSLPEEILNQTTTKIFWERYISLNVFLFSIKDLFGMLERNAQYDVVTGDFSQIVMDEFKPDNIVTNRKEPNPNWKYNVVYKDSIVHYKRLREIFPEADFVGYMPHKSLWDIARIEFLGGTDNTLEVMYEVSKVFDRFYDFTVASKVTSDPLNTPDGFHYDMKTLIDVINVIEEQVASYSLAVHTMSRGEYMRDYKKALDDFIVHYNLKPAEDLRKPDEPNK